MQGRFKQVRAGFSLVELVVVIVIIGLLAAMAIPRLSRGATGATDAALAGNLHMMRMAIQQYAAEHHGAYPGLHKIDGLRNADGDEDDFYEHLLGCSTPTGAGGSCDPPRVFGPYLAAMPRLNVGLNASRKADKIGFSDQSPPKVVENNKKGWQYNPETGEIIANTEASDANGTPYKDY